MFKFSLILNDDDYFEFNKYHLLYNPMNRKPIMLYRSLTPLLSALVILILWIADSDFTLILIEFILLTVLSVLWIIFTKPIISRILKKNIINLKKSDRLPYSKEVTLVFDNESFIEITPETETKTKYSVIERIVTAEKPFIFIPVQYKRTL